MNFKIGINTFSLALALFSIALLSLLLLFEDHQNFIPITAQPSENINKKERVNNIHQKTKN